MDLIVTDTNGTPSGSYASWTLDLAYGSGENDFDLRCPARLQPGCRWWVDGTGWGGIVDDVKTSVTGGEGEAQETRCAACCGEGAAEACNAPAKRAGHKSR